MTTTGSNTSLVSANFPLKRCLWRAIGLALLWLGLNGLDGASWMVGAPAVLLAIWVSMKLLPIVTWRWTVGGVLAFASFFLRESVRGGWDVARRALSPAMRLAPGIISYSLRLPAGPARLFFCGTVSLLPGTAVVAIAPDEIQVHVLDQSARVAVELRELERRVAALFGHALPDEPGVTP